MRRRGIGSSPSSRPQAANLLAVGRGGKTLWHGPVEDPTRHCGLDVAALEGSGRYVAALEIAYRYRRGGAAARRRSGLPVRVRVPVLLTRDVTAAP
jgi:hypothetical protein